MKKLVVLGMGLCVALAFSSCKSSESAYKKAYEKAKQQELAEAPADQVEATPVEAAPVVSAPVTTAPVAGPVREEKVELVSGDGLKAYSVVCGSFGVKANAEGLKQYLDGQGYNAKVVYNAERNMYRVIASSYDDRAQATQAKEEFKAKYPNRDDFQKAWLLYRVYTEHRQSLLGAGSLRHLVAGEAQVERNHLADGVFVFHNQDLSHVHSSRRMS